MLFTLFCTGWSALHCGDEWEVKCNDSVLGLGHQQQVWVAGYGTSAIIPIIRAECGDNVPGQHPSLPAQPSVWRHLAPISRVVTR